MKTAEHRPILEASCHGKVGRELRGACVELYDGRKRRGSTSVRVRRGRVEVVKGWGKSAKRNKGGVVESMRGEKRKQKCR